MRNKTAVVCIVRCVRTSDGGGTMAFVSYNNTYSLTLRRTIRQPIERVWRAITNSQERPLWLDPPLQFDFRPGGLIRTAEGLPIAEFIEYEPAERWMLRWMSPLNRGESKVVVEIVRVNRVTTRLSVRHWNIQTEHDYHELYAGWLWFLDSLERYFTTEKYLEYEYPDVYGKR